MTTIWALVDDRAGNTSQVLGVAEALSKPFIIKNIRYNHLGRISNVIKGSSLLGLTADTKKELSPPWPDIVISIASKMESAALYIKKQNPKTKLVHIQRPRFPISKFDLVATPEHDFLGKNRDKKIPTNVILTLGAPNRINAEALAKGQIKWIDKFKHLPQPHIAVLVGGSTNKGKFTIKHAMELADEANEMARKSGGSLLVTTSRRTPDKVIKKLQEELREPKFFFDANKGGENPYAGLLACADAIIVTGDSVSMCSESCSTGKPVYIYSPLSLTPPKYRYFQQRLIGGGYALILGDKLEPNPYAPLNDAKIIAECILSL
jgi:uncharacterized protein